MSLSQSVRARAKAREMAASTRSVTRRAHAECTVTTIHAINRIEQASHTLPVVPIVLGSGGGAPVGRRRRRPHRADGGT